MALMTSALKREMTYFRGPRPDLSRLNDANTEQGIAHEQLFPQSWKFFYCAFGTAFILDYMNDILPGGRKTSYIFSSHMAIMVSFATVHYSRYVFVWLPHTGLEGSEVRMFCLHVHCITPFNKFGIIKRRVNRASLG